jgi:mono/diheme cytochrome c family protein
MTRTVAHAGTALVALGLMAATLAAQQSQTPHRPASAKATAPKSQTVKPVPAVSHPSPKSAVPPASLISEYCVTCHNDKGKAGGLSLVTFDPSRADRDPEVAEKIIRKLRAGMMPPPGVKRPEPATLKEFTASLEGRIDSAAALNPNPGHRTFQRLNRAEYARAVRDLFAIDVDVNAFLPPDTISHNFDNIADVQNMSPVLLEGYLRAAARISTLAVGDPTATPTEATYQVPRTENQLRHVDGAPFGTRGGISVVHVFPADGEYTFRMMLHSIPTGQLYGSTSRGEQIEVSINGERAALMDINPRMSEADANGMNITTPPVFVKAGPQRVSAAFLQKWESPVDDLLVPVEYTLADTQIGSAIGITTVPHLRDLAISGPKKVTGVSDTPSRRRVFTCRPLSAAEEAPCAKKIVTQIATQAYRRPVTAEDVNGLMGFYDKARKDGDFEAGIRTAVQAILASPHFVFRIEEEPAAVRPGQNYRIADLDLASRLSFFLWGTTPDAELLKVASQGTLKTPAVFARQVRRMLADSRSEALATRFAAQWLRLQDLDKIHPDALLYPAYDHTLAESMRRETELLFNAIVHEDRPVLELLTADYTFVNERLARHYGIPNVSGPNFQRVKLADENRRGILGHGSILMQTSVADRTSPVLRGKWIMEVLLGTPPPPPPPNVPAFEETKAVAAGRALTVRERMEEHRRNPQCMSCHRMIDPLGLALENFDVTGAWRIKDAGAPVDPVGKLFDGTDLNGPASLRQALLSRPDSLLRNFTENLMAFALGRRIEFYDQPTIRAVVQKAAANEHRFSSYVLGVVTSPAFQMSRAEAPTSTTTQQDPSSAKRK